ncbi:MAG: tRNA (N6-threonylcarbamoyladenosine(37)-N6)-methyltransferase TrmO [Desulfitobacterium hafniense]|nr:tRNA (N6-threonylcarbamoyladenosine(37)-N6)-methyltransferase TrmO [Desulfitobacterium hafniense]
MDITFKQIGSIHTPYLPGLPVPQQPVQDAKGEFWLKLDPEYLEGLTRLNEFKYIIVIYYLDQVKNNFKSVLTESWASEISVGVFASRNENRPNPIGLSIVELKGVEGNEVLISNIDVHNNTPLLDIKPYVKAFDLKDDANDGWIETIPEKEHVLAHLLGHSHHHDSDSNHNHSHSSDISHNHGHSHKYRLKHNHNHNHADHHYHE